jgi:CRISPR-associated protein Cas1
MKSFYILKSGRLKRKSNNLYFEYKEKDKKIKKSLPIKIIDSLYFFGEINTNSKALNFLAYHKIPVHFFNYYGFYTGSFMPRSTLESGFLLVNQVKFYLDTKLRLEIAKEFVTGAIHNTIKNLIYYKKQGKPVDKEIGALKSLLRKVSNVASMSELMAIEGNAKKIYYSTFGSLLGSDFEIEKRTKRPPNNMINCLISFGNSLLYTVCLSAIYQTQLNPAISFLHEPGERRFSLSLDIAEIFKPVIVDKVIFNLVNKNIIKEKHFMKELNFTYLNDKGKRIFLEEFEKRLNTVIKHKKMNRYISYKTLIRLELYKLIKHLVGDEIYKSFKIL